MKLRHRIRREVAGRGIEKHWLTKPLGSPGLNLIEFQREDFIRSVLWDCFAALVRPRRQRQPRLFSLRLVQQIARQ